MSVDRREFLKLSGIGLGGMAVQLSSGPDTSKMPASASGPSDDCMGVLYDAAKCIGCKACQVACREERSGVKEDLLPSEMDVFPDELNDDTWTLIKLYQNQEDKAEYSFVKVQCMHCVDPACVSACPVAALQKTENGPVIYDDSVCMGCRYCMAACPFEIPKYQWEEVFPLIRKCDFCADRQEQGLPPACASACTNDALVYGKRSDLLKEARARIDKQPDLYVDHIYGEHEIGGTSYLYISHVPFENLGFPELDTKSLPDRTWPWMSAVPGIFAGMATLMTSIYFVTKNRVEKKAIKEK